MKGTNAQGESVQMSPEHTKDIPHLCQLVEDGSGLCLRLLPDSVAKVDLSRSIFADKLAHDMSKSPLENVQVGLRSESVDLSCAV